MVNIFSILDTLYIVSLITFSLDVFRRTVLGAIVDQQNVDIWVMSEKGLDTSLSKVFGLVINDNNCDVFKCMVPVLAHSDMSAPY